MVVRSELWILIVAQLSDMAPGSDDSIKCSEKGRFLRSVTESTQ